jgi:hypothetical protein
VETSSIKCEISYIRLVTETLKSSRKWIDYEQFLQNFRDGMGG